MQLHNFELLYKEDSNPLPKKLKETMQTMQGRSLIWYNTFWDTMAGGHDDDASLQDFNNGYYCCPGKSKSTSTYAPIIRLS